MGLTEYDGSLPAYGLEFEPESLHVSERAKLEFDWSEEMSGLVGEERSARLSGRCVQDRCRAIQVDAHLNMYTCTRSCDTHVTSILIL